MTRRDFLATSTVVGLSSALSAEEVSREKKRLHQVEAVIEAVQSHLFPEGSRLPSAKSMKMTRFLIETITHRSYDKDIRAFVIDGAEELQSRTKGRFVQMNAVQKERELRAYEETSYGSNWLSRILTLSMEALFSDPIYGSNIDEAGWKAVESYGGEPRPQEKYIDG